MAMVRTNPKGIRATTAAAERELTRRFSRAGSVLVSETRRLINRSNRTGRNPSVAGEPPKKVTGTLQRGQRFEVRKRGRELFLRFGSNVKYQRRLELGFVGVDSRGRVYNQGARPHLRTALGNKRSEVKRIMRGDL